MNWCVPIFTAVDARLFHSQLYMLETSQLEVYKCVRKLKLISTTGDRSTNATPTLIFNPSSSASEVDSEAEKQCPQIRENADTWYSSLDTLRQVLLKYKIPHIPAMLELFTAFDGYLGAAAHDPTVQIELAKIK